MTLVIGTVDGLNRTPDVEFDDATGLLDATKVYDITHDDGVWYVATVDDLFRSADGMDTWTRLDVPVEAVTAVAVSPDGGRVYAGTMPAYVYVSTDDGTSWHDLEGFQRLPSRDRSSTK